MSVLIIHYNNNEMHHASLLTLLSFVLCLCFSGIELHAQQYYYKNNNSNSVKVEVGDAVYYADYLHGRTTALGEVYRMEAYTCAHRTYPKGTLLKVTRLDNGQSVVCRVNDRGPYSKGDVVDISKVAAMKIGLIRDGRTRVSVEPVGTSATNPGEGTTTARQTPAQYTQTQQSNSVYYPTPERYAAKNQLTAKSGYYNPNQQTQRGTTPSSYNNVNTSRINTSASNSTRVNSQSQSVDILAPGVKGYAIQIASFKNIDNAKRQVVEIKQKGINDVYLMQKSGLNKVVIAAFDNKFAAQQYLDRLRQQYMIDGIVVMLR